MSQTAVEAAIVVTLALFPAHGETIVNPSPAPSNTRVTVSVDAAKAPAMIGPQCTAGCEDLMGVATFVGNRSLHLQPPSA